MRPVRLSMTAFGPFVKTQVIDFEALGEKPLFLINGTTGSGKTTILDAICFALYGQTTGKEREAAQMRCDYADDKTLTEVEFIFELADTTYRIKRIPVQQRAKNKGEGTMEQKATAELYRRDDDDGDDDRDNRSHTETVLVARKVSDATKQIEQLTGLQVDQFRQVMVLPQGKFREFLMADSKAREDIFKQLFETHIYTQIENKLKAKAKDVALAVARLKEKQQGVLVNAELDTFDELLSAIATLIPEHDKASSIAKTNEQNYLKLVKEQEALMALAKDFDNLDSQLIKIDQYKQQLVNIKEKKRHLIKAEQAQKIAPCFSELSRCNQALTATIEQLEQANKTHKKNKVLKDAAKQELSNNAKRLKQLDDKKQLLVTLKSYHQRSASLLQAQQDLSASQTQQQTGEKGLVLAQQQFDKDYEEHESGVKEKEELESRLEKSTEISLLYKTLTDQLEQKQHINALVIQKKSYEDKLEELVKNGNSLKKQYVDKQNQLKQLDLLWHNGQAAILSKELAQDQACPVCGSTDHPAPATAEQAIPGEDERELAQNAVEKAEQVYQQARDEYKKVKVELNSVISQISTEEKRLGEAANSSVENLRLQHTQVSEQRKQNQQFQQRLDVLKKQLIGLKRSQDIARKGLDAIKTQQVALIADVASNKAKVENSEKELPQEYRQARSLENAIQVTAKAIDTLTKSINDVQQAYENASKALTQAKTTLENLESRLEKDKDSINNATSEWAKQLEQSPFNNDHDYKISQLDEAIVKQLKSDIEDFESRYQQAQGALQQQQKLLKGKSKPDLPLFQEKVTNAQLEKESSEAKLKQLDIQLAGLRKARKTLATFAEELVEKEKLYRVVGTLSDVANGVTGNKISLQRFVLGVLLDDVLIAASARLTLMSKGRYVLLRKEDRAKGNKASGLELEVEDSYTGKVRAVATLSGGESFMASLSLALGLSDVVQAYAGGIRLDTLFIDEGFGSLDADALDLAIRTLIDLRNTGRMVGIISHVSELKEQISLRIDVKSSPVGSHIEIIN
ncbi:MAG: SMC family ATPase [Thiotrichaceae bacterium]